MAVHPRACGEHRSAAVLRENQAVHPRACGEHGLYDSGRSPTPVHPRACGEHPDGFAFCGRWYGSSPRLRGTQPRWRHLHGGGGSSPRLRGTHRLQLLDHDHLLHPRACGEHMLPFPAARCRRGSSRACGEHRSSSSITITCGSSPRLRGTHAPFPAARCRRVHPRACGEHASPPAACRPSSVHPAPAGNTHLCRVMCRHVRFIPAPAGNTARGCGRIDGDRSSPRLRGTLVGAHPISVGWRFIPAPAGTHLKHSRIIIRRFIPAPAGTHPQTFPDNHFDGSSPRLRGTLRHLPLRTPRVGSSPACGNTARAPQPLFAARFIPAPAGNTPAQQIADRLAGSSPRLREPALAASAQRHFRFIPAPAGNTLAAALRCWRYPVHPAPAGTRLKADAEGWRSRFIPAPAGNTAESRCRRLALAVHPAPAGTPGFTVRCAARSSPRLRGTLSMAGIATATPVIPAPAGNTPARHRCRADAAVHPRACGEHTTPADLRSPGLRFIPAPAGNTHSGCVVDRTHRFIPAPAGNTSPADRERSAAFIPAPAGNTGMRSKRPVKLIGSSRACGEHCSPDRVGRLLRFIPAPAGNTIAEARWCARRMVHPRACGEHSSASRAWRRRPVHPRACGEHSFWKRLIRLAFYDVKQRTDVSAPFRRPDSASRTGPVMPRIGARRQTSRGPALRA